MGVRQYALGKKHGLNGVRALAHRRNKRYDSIRANQSYHNGYREGYKQRHMSGGKVGLDYSNPLNNRIMDG